MNFFLICDFVSDLLKDMRKEYTLAAKDVTLSLSKDPYGPKEKQDLGKSDTFLNRS